MGFLVDSTTVSTLGVTVTDAYVSIRGTFSVIKRHAPSPFGHPHLFGESNLYSVYATYYVSSANDTELKPLYEGTCILRVDTIPTNPIDDLYAKIKLDFPGKTFTDDL